MPSGAGRGMARGGAAWPAIVARRGAALPGRGFPAAAGPWRAAAAVTLRPAAWRGAERRRPGFGGGRPAAAAGPVRFLAGRCAGGRAPPAGRVGGEAGTEPGGGGGAPRKRSGAGGREGGGGDAAAALGGAAVLKNEKRPMEVRRREARKGAAPRRAALFTLGLGVTLNISSAVIAAWPRVSPPFPPPPAGRRSRALCSLFFFLI